MTNKESDKLLRKIPCFVAALGNHFVARQGHERYHQGALPPGGQDLRHHAQSGGAGNPARHRGGLGSGRSGHPAKILWLHRQQYQGKAHQFGVHRFDCGQAAIAVKVRRSRPILKEKAPLTCEWNDMLPL